MSLSGRIRTSVVTALVTGVGALFAAGCGLLGTASPAAASGKLQSIFEAPPIEGPTAPAGDIPDTLGILRYLGADIVRVNAAWSYFAPNPEPAGFNASDPNSYSWGWLDTVVNDARKDGLSVDLILSGSAPSWAVGPGAPSGPEHGSWEPSATAYGQYVHAIAAHFPQVHFWELWNEANWGPGLAPQYLHSSVPVSAKYYRALVNAGWRSLRSTGHGHDTISIGNLSQDGSGHVGEYGTTAPLTLMRTVYCLNTSYKPLKGSAARQAGCSGSKSAFKRANPALFSVSGVGIHPYPYGNPPSKTLFPNPNGAEFNEIPQVAKAIDNMQKAYGSHKRLAVYNTEYGYRTRPNDTARYFANPQQAAGYLNQSEYLSWKNPRIATYDQYELVDQGWFPTGLFWAQHTRACPGNDPFACPKPSFYAYRLPIWLPVTTAKKGHPLEVWGEVRPADYAQQDTGKPQFVQIQWAPKGSSSYRTKKTVRIGNPYGYFDTHMKFPGSGSVRLTWSYPPSSTDAGLIDPLVNLLPGVLPAAATASQIYSRTTSITLH
jgi:hypothetical protein